MMKYKEKELIVNKNSIIKNKDNGNRFYSSNKMKRVRELLQLNIKENIKR